MKGNKKNIIIIVLIFALIIIVGFGSYIRSKSNNKFYEIDVSNVEVNSAFFESMSEKELIHYKILNSIDFFNTAMGKYEKKNNATNEQENITYAVDVANKRSYGKYIDNSEKEELVVKDDKKIEINNISKTYREFSIEIQPKDEVVKLLKPRERYLDRDTEIIRSGNKYAMEEGFISRIDGGFIYIGAESIFSLDYLPSYLKEYDNWDIVGHGEYLGRNYVEISGEIGLGKYSISRFKSLVDENTGIILKMEFLNSKDEIISSLVTKNISLDVNIDESFFNIDLSGYTEQK